MKTKLLFAACILSIFSVRSQAQGVTQINNNNSLHGVAAVTSTLAIVVSSIDSSIWVTDASKAGTVPLGTTVKYEAYGFVLSGKFIFRGSTPATGSEIYITDGTAGGTTLIKDIYPGTTGSAPADFSVLNNVVYFSARTAAEGRELWKTDGTADGTSLVKDIVPGIDSSNSEGEYHLFSAGNYLLFAARTPATGVELWKSDGTTLGTVLLKDINTGNAGADSSNPDNFYPLNGITLFTATDATHGKEIWTTNGTSTGTLLLKDINPGTGGFSDVELYPGFSYSFFFGFHTFNNHAYFQANDGTSSGELWSTDGTSTNTILLKDIVSGTGLSVLFTADGVNYPGKFIFPVSDGSGGTRSELWQSDGTPGGTVLFQSFTPVSQGDIPVIYVPYVLDLFTGARTEQLFQGNKFFLAARTPTQGRELWISDGTMSGTQVVKDINPGAGSGVDTTGFDYLYTSTELFFAANDGTHGNELWQSDGTNAGTSMVKDINPNSADADPSDLILFNNKVIFSATDGDDLTATDLFVVNGTFNSLPVELFNLTVISRSNNALLQWSTQQEINTKNYIIQRSYDGQHFNNIGSIIAHGNTSIASNYSFIDPGALSAGYPVLYYRLNIIDNDGKSAFSNIISLKINESTTWSVRVITIPVQDFVNIMVNGINGQLKLSVLDISGRTMFTKSYENINGQISLPVQLPKGMYLLQSDYNNERRIIKFIR